MWSRHIGHFIKTANGNNKTTKISKLVINRDLIMEISPIRERFRLRDIMFLNHFTPRNMLACKHSVGKSNFKSEIVILIFIPNNLISKGSEQKHNLFKRLTTYTFTKQRKNLLKNLKGLTCYKYLTETIVIYILPFNETFKKLQTLDNFVDFNIFFLPIIKTINLFLNTLYCIG